MFFRQFFIEGLAHASYMVGERDGRVAVIDPIRDIDLYLNAAREDGVSISAVLDTHIHADYVSGAKELAERTGASLYLSAEGGDEWQYQFPMQPLHDGDAFAIGPYRFTAVHTPGHTPEHLMYLLADTSRSDEPWVGFTGDFLFVGDLGRPDLLGQEEARGLAEQLYESVQKKLPPLPDGLEVYPNHGEGSLCGRSMGGKRSTTLGYERRFNYALQPMDKSEFLRRVIEGQPPAPAYFRRMKVLNKEGAPPLGSLPYPRPLSAACVRELIDNGAVVVDARSAEAFGGAHIPGSYSNPMHKLFCTWAGYVIPPGRHIVLVLESPGQWDNAVRQLLRAGYDDIAEYLEGGIGGWEQAGFPLAELHQMSADDLKHRVEAREKLLLLDVRTESEFDSGHVPEAVLMHAGLLPDQWTELESRWGASKDTPIAVICRTGHRASIAASILQQKGFGNVCNVSGGMTAWRRVDGPISATS